MVTINGLPTRREWKTIVAMGHIVDTQVPCALPPVDPTTWAGAHARRDAMRAAERTRRVNHYIMGKTSLVGDWVTRDAPWMKLFARPVDVDTERIYTKIPLTEEAGA
jgi:hypothetical protein